MRRILYLASAALALLIMVLSWPGASAATGRYAAFANGSLESEGDAALQPLTAPARVGRVAVVPDSDAGEAWAIGRSTGRAPGWSDDAQGQVVFLRATKSAPWQVVGPPRDGGKPVNPALGDLALSSTGEGWAVGADGLLLRKAKHASEWVVDAASGQVTTALLQSVSLVEDDGHTVGYAVGKASPNGSGQAATTILRYDGSHWTREAATTEMVADGSPGLIAVAAVSADEAWAVSDETVAGVRVYHRTNGAWRKVSTGQQVFDGPFPAPSPGGGAINQDARAASVAATKKGAWVGGSLRPADAASLAGGSAGDTSRPFVLHVTDSSTTSYCPDRYEVRTAVGEGTAPDVSRFCDKPFPTAPFDVPSLAAVSDDEVFAGGLGLFHFKDGGWFREPDADGYIVSLAMSSATEGWTASGGGTYFRGNGVRAVSTLMGHWTDAPFKAKLARWPQSQSQPLESVAVAPDGRALAVGATGAAIAFDRELGWDATPSTVELETLHGVAWAGDTAFAVGGRGVIYHWDGAAWHADAASGVVPRTLFGVAFRGAGDGVAVGAAGTVLRYDGTAWRVDDAASRLSGETLYAVAATDSGYVVVGAHGTVLEQDAGRWRVRDDAKAAAQRAEGPADLYAVTAMPDGGVAVGGASSTLLTRPWTGDYGPAATPIDGTVLALASGPTGNRAVRLLASVSPDPRKFNGDEAAAMRGTVMLLESGAWRDVGMLRRSTAQPGTDSSSFDEPAMSLAFDGAAGWAAGGTLSGVQDAEGHLRSEPSSSVYRVDVDRDPSPPDASTKPALAEGVNFAVFGESWCGRGLCGSLAGSGPMADLVALHIRDEINRAAKLEHGPRFVLFTGNMRSSGVPEELAEFRAFLRGFDIPVYAAVGDRDLFAGVGGASAVNRNTTSQLWRDAFAEMPAPWGTGEAPSGIRPVQSTTERGAGAATHYAFDVLDHGNPVLRVLVVDSSSKSLGDASTQNPPEQQSIWLDTVETEAQVARIPMVVAMNQPTVLPDNIQYPNWAVDQQTFEASVATHGVTAVFTGGLRVNTTDTMPARSGVVPLYILGGGGAPLGFDQSAAKVTPTKLPTDGFYHAWHMANVWTDPLSRNTLGQAPLKLDTFATMDSLAMRSLDGKGTGAGNTMRFSALGRGLPGGFSDLDQAKAAYLPMGAGGLNVCRGPGQGGTVCLSANAIQPPYRFYSENPDIADFVLPDFGKGGREPLVDLGAGLPGTILRDPAGRFGLLCTFKAGTVGIDVVSGFFRRRMEITVGGGDGPCVDHPIEALLPEARPVAPVPPTPVPQVQLLTPPAGLLASPSFTPPLDALAIVLPPPPAPIVAPAPPASAAGAKKEESEHQTESASQDGGDGEAAEFTAIRHHERQSPLPDPSMWLAASAVLLGMLGGVVGARAAVRRREWAWQEVKS
jgi:hypothetical protein